VDDQPVLVLGGYGETGSRIARLLMRHGTAVIIAGRDRFRAEAFADELQRGSVSTRAQGIGLDARDATALRRSLEGVGLVVNATAASTVPGAAVAAAALDAGANVLDVQFPAWADAAVSARAEAEGRIVITQAGFHPGVPAALIRWAGSRMDVERAWVGGLLRPAGGLPYTPAVDDLVESFRSYRACTLRGGRWIDVPWWSPNAMPRVWFDFGFGRQWTAVMDLDELRPLPELLPSLREAGFSVSGFDLVTDTAMTVLIFSALPLWGRRPVTPISKLLCWSTRVFGRPPFGIVLQLEAEGRTPSGRLTVRLGLFHEDGYDLTAIPAVSMIEQVLDRSARAVGLRPMGLVVDPDRLLADCVSMGVRVRALGRGAVEGLARTPATGARRPRSRPS
jgi:saccharopine dehydrogenase (NAD+, L-lysine-forming)